MHDLFHARNGEGQDSVATLKRDDEVRILSAADVVFAIQEEERRFVDTHVRSTRAVLVPMPAQVASDPSPGADDSVLFVGSNTAPNSVGLAWFLERVWPSVRLDRPNCVLNVAGTVNRAFEGRATEGVRFLGLVPDLSSLYSQAGVVISPLTFGSGLKIKLVEGLAAGKAMIVTSTTLQGVEPLCCEAVICTDDPQEFASSLVRACSDGEVRRSLACQALACATRHFSVIIAHEDLRQWAKNVAGLTPAEVGLPRLH
jgi:succinoglycan biosynthesis protein ExoO